MAEEEGKSAAEVRGSCLLAAPAGCASFQMKFGATTAHRAFGVGVRSCKKWTDVQKQGKAYQRVLQRLKAAALIVLDEFSMIGRRFFGKIAFKVQDTLGTPAVFGKREVSMAGSDVVITGHHLQAPPVMDRAVFQGAAKMSGEEKAGPGTERPAGEVSACEFGAMGPFVFPGVR